MSGNEDRASATDEYSGMSRQDLRLEVIHWEKCDASIENLKEQKALGEEIIRLRCVLHDAYTILEAEVGNQFCDRARQLITEAIRTSAKVYP